jgi:hypothetical protein
MVNIQCSLRSAMNCDLRRCDNDLSINQLLVELRVLALLVRGRDQGVALILEPFADAQLVLSRAEQLGDLSSVIFVSFNMPAIVLGDLPISSSAPFPMSSAPPSLSADDALG